MASPLDQSASIPVLRRLIAAGVVSIEEGEQLEQRLRRQLPWAAWLNRGLLVLGVILIIFGIGYFFAHNWRHLTDNDKLALSAGAVLVALLVATRLGFDTFPGKVFLLAASVLVGGFIGVFGSVYQSSAEDWTIFGSWALLITPWVLLGRFPSLWIFWIYLLNVALFFYWQKFMPNWDFDPASEPLERWSVLSLLLLNVAALAGREVGAGRGIAWLDKGWSALALIAVIYFVATFQMVAEILASFEREHSIGPTFLGLVIYAALAGGTYWQFARVRPSLPALALGTLGACVTLTVLVARLLFNEYHGEPMGQMLLMGLLTLAIFGGGVYFLRAMGREFKTRSNHA